MKIIHAEARKGQYKLQVENLDDLWYLNDLLSPQDIVKARTLRKIKRQTDNERATSAVKKPVTLKIKLEKIEFSKYQNTLRLLGTILEAPEDIPLGTHHTIAVEENTLLTIEKEKWYNYQLDKLHEAAEEKVPQILICVMDREEAFFALLKKYGYELLLHLTGKVQQKGSDEKIESSFYKEIIAQLQTYSERYKATRIVIASPAFFKEDLMKEVKDSVIKEKIILATCSAVGKNGINEVLKRDEIKKALKEARSVKEFALVGELMTEIARNGKAAYGLKDIENLVAAGAVDQLLIADSLIQKMRAQETFDRLDRLMKQAEFMKGHVHIISTGHEGGKQLEGLGGIGAILRYQLQY
jgi:protein pelota